MLRINQLKLPVEHTREQLERKVLKLLHLSKVPEIIIVRRSVDARKKPELYFNYILDIVIILSFNFKSDVVFFINYSNRAN